MFNNMDKNFYSKNLKCPVCSNEFTVKCLYSSAYSLERKDTDLCPYYKGINPILYLLWICPNCQYTSYKKDFSSLSSYEVKTIAAICKDGKCDEKFLIHPRDFDIATRIFEFAAELYVERDNKLPSVAASYLYIAWFYRYKGVVDDEKKYLEKAYRAYYKAYENSEIFPETLLQCGVAYLAGDIARRLGKDDEALRWFATALKSPDIKKRKFIKRLIEEHLDYYKPKETV